MSWQTLLQAQRIKPHRTSHQELSDLRDVVECDLQDSAVEELSADRRFATTYNAVLQLAKMVIACSGYRVVGASHHLTTFEALEIAMGSSVGAMVAYLIPVAERGTRSTTIARMRQPNPRPRIC